MKAIVLDLEAVVQFEDKHIDNSPFNPANKIVSAHWTLIDTDSINIDDVRATPNLIKVQHSVYFHNEQAKSDPKEAFQKALDEAELLVAHNAKFDVMWLIEAGFRIPDHVYCTMIGEYILARGNAIGFSLEDSAQRRKISLKKSELIKELWAQHIGFEAMPLDTVLEYADADVVSCAELFLWQQKAYGQERNISLRNIVALMNDMLMFIVEIERNGIMIDLVELDRVEQEYLKEKAEIEKRLNDIVYEVMGDTPINLNSGPDMVAVIYSRKVKDRNEYINTFNIGTDATGKPLRPPFMSPNKFVQSVRNTTEVVYRTDAHHCDVCHGTGMIRKVRKNGELYKKDNKCTVCAGRGYTLTSNGKVAGLKLSPRSVHDVSIHGFKTDKETILALIEVAKEKKNDKAIEFLTKISRLNAITTYLSSFIGGIKRWVRDNGLIHPNFNQATTATARLSSSNPNFQNQPKSRKFPVRKCIISRFVGGKIVEADFSGLEFRVAGELSRDQQIIDDVANGKDTHKQTGSIVHRKPMEEVTKDERQDVKPHTFAPLYGATGADQPPHIKAYYQEFFNIYKGMKKQHEVWMNSVLMTSIVRTPSGREYQWHNVRRLKNGRVTNATQIVNYPVQGYATGDIVPLACIRAYRAFKHFKLKSKLMLTVHDSIVADAHPDEVGQVCRILAWAMKGVTDEVEVRFGYKHVIPLDFEAVRGDNWMEGSTVEIEFDRDLLPAITENNNNLYLTSIQS